MDIWNNESPGEIAIAVALPFFGEQPGGLRFERLVNNMPLPQTCGVLDRATILHVICLVRHRERAHGERRDRQRVR